MVKDDEKMKNGENDKKQCKTMKNNEKGVGRI